MTWYMAREEELDRRRKVLLDEKNKLAEEMKIHGEQIGQDSQASEEAHKRNQMLLKDFQTSLKNLKRRLQVGPDPSLVKLEDQYWTSVEEELPKWELFLLGKAQQPFGVNQNHNSKMKLRHSRSMEAPRKKSLPPSGFSSNTFPRVV